MPGGANSLEMLWKEIGANIDAVGEVPPSRWDVNRSGDPSIAKRVVYGAFITGADFFDNRAFTVSDAEALRWTLSTVSFWRTATLRLRTRAFEGPT